MKKFLVTAMTILVCASTYGQARKCTGPDGRVTYSDVVCSTAGTSQTVNTNANTVDGSASRRDAQKYQAEKDEAEANLKLDTLRQSNPVECRFAYQAHGDVKGKKLAWAAKEECLKGKLGMSNSKEAHLLWKDHQATNPTICSTSGIAIGKLYAGSAVCR